MKKFYESRTIWFNTLMTLVLVAQLVGGLYAQFAGITALVAGIGNIVLRVWFTDKKIAK